MSTESRLKDLESKVDELARLVKTRIVDEFPGLLNRLSAIEGGVAYASNLYFQAEQHQKEMQSLADRSRVTRKAVDPEAETK